MFCGHCGTPPVSATQSFCQSCGKPLGQPASSAPAAPAAPAQGWQQPVGAVPGPMPGPIPGPVTDSAAPGPDGQRRGAGRLVAAAVGGIAVLAVGGFAAFQLLGSGSGGAASPESVVVELIEAVESQDPLAAIDLLNPHETEGLGEIAESFRDRLAEEGLTEDSGPLTEAFSLEVTELETSMVEEEEGIARVRITRAEADLSYDPTEVPDELLGGADPGDPEERSFDLAEEFEDESEMDLVVTVVEVDGDWYLSPVATWLDFAIEDDRTWDEDLPRPDYSRYAETETPVTGDDAEDAIRASIDSLDTTDPEAFLATLPEGQAAILRPFIPALEHSLAEEDVTLEVELEELEGSTSDDGDWVRFVLERGKVAVTVEEYGEQETGYFMFEDNCVWDEDPYGYESSPECIPSHTGIDEISVMVRETGDGWQVDPVATGMDYLSRVLADMDVEELADQVRGSW